MLLTFKKEQITNRNLQDICRAAAKAAGLETQYGLFDSTRLTISEDIQDALYAFYQNKGWTPDKTTAYLLMYGPKVNPNLTEYTAETDTDFVTFPMPDTMITPDVLRHYHVKTEENLPQNARQIPPDYDPLCIVTQDPKKGTSYFRLTWSSEHCEEAGMIYMDYTIFDENYMDIDGGLISIPKRIHNLVDALDYAGRQDTDIRLRLGSRETWHLIDEEAIMSVCKS